MKKGIFPTLLSLFLGSSVALGQSGPIVSVQPPMDYPSVGFHNPEIAPSHTRIWGSAEYLLWWVKNSPGSGPLVTTSSRVGVLDAAGNDITGGVGAPGTSILQGDSFRYGSIPGGRVTLGGWFDCDGTIGMEVSGFLLSQRSSRSTFSSDANGNPSLFFPIIDASGLGGGRENSIEIASPTGPGGPAISGSVTTSSRIRLWGAEANGVINGCRNERWTLDFLVGFRYVELSEDLSIDSSSSNTVPVAAGGGISFLGGLFDGTTFTSDSFRTRNQFFGGQVGVRATADFGKMFVSASTKVALGSNHQIVDIQGSSRLLTTAGATATSIGGVYAQPSNIGRRTQNAFSVIPEVEFKLGYNFTQRLSGFVGYNFMYWSDVVRPGSQIDRNVDIRQVSTSNAFAPGVRTSPSPQFRDSDFWAHGVNFGLQFKF